MAKMMEPGAGKVGEGVVMRGVGAAASAAGVARLVWRGRPPVMSRVRRMCPGAEPLARICR